ncbi:unnamed protein product [Clavelina lepadiformis]|uniref:Sulfotransferase n=1 Tax=Clavelina lepadiformis TaxID=159417 RepID=A0ABP0FYT4_CLALP
MSKNPKLLCKACFGFLVVTGLLYTILYKYQRYYGYRIYNSGLKAEHYETNPVNQNVATKVVQSSISPPEIQQIKPGAVILLTHTRSGSSFVGEIFNQKRGVAYFYEPLYPFGTCPRTSSNLAEEYFPNALRLNFSSAWESYIKGNKLSQRKQLAGCVSQGVCFANCLKCSLFLSRDQNICHKSPNGGQACPNKLDMTKLSEAVEKSDLMAFKVVSMCDISWIQPLLDDPTINLKIVHLVRDPRAIINSRPNNNRVELIKQGCKHITDLLDYADRHLVRSKNYMIIRHEDFALNPLNWTEKVYKFVGLRLDKEVDSWLKSATSDKNSNQLSKSNPFGTKRNSIDTISHWRKELSWENVLLVQMQCTAMKRLGYVKFSSEEYFKNMTIPSFKHNNTM